MKKVDQMNSFFKVKWQSQINKYSYFAAWFISYTYYILLIIPTYTQEFNLLHTFVPNKDLKCRIVRNLCYLNCMQIRALL